MDEKKLRNLVDPALTHFKNHQIKDFEVFYLNTSALKIESKNRQIDALSQAGDQGISFRVIKDKKLGFSFTTSLDPASLLRAAESAIEITSIMPEDPHHQFEKLSTTYTDETFIDESGVKKENAFKRDLAFALEDACMSHDSRIKGVRSAAFSENHAEVHLLDSSLNHATYKKVLFSLSVTCKAEENGDSQMGGEFDFAFELAQLDPKKVGKDAAKLALEGIGATAAPTMSCPAVFRNSVVADLLDFLSASFSIEEVEKGRSLLAKKIGMPIFSNQIQIFDDATMKNGYATRPFDAEGSASLKISLVENGVLKAFLYDQYYARKSGSKTTAHASRSIKTPPSIGNTNLYIQNGKTEAPQLITNIKKGVLITDLMGIHTANPVTGDFSLGATGILIENGILTKPIRGFAVAGNILGLFNKINSIGNDLRFFGSTGAPSISVTELSVGGN